MTCGAATPPREVDGQAGPARSPEQPAARIVHELDGIDHPVDPRRLLITGSALWGAWLDHRPGVVPDLLIGLGISGIIPTIAVAIASGLPYLLTWPLDCDVCHERPDPGSRIGRGEFLASGRVQGKRVLIVDDQVIDGHVLASFVSRLRDRAADVAGVLCLIEDTAGTGRRRVESTGVALCAVRTP